jgi:integrase
MAVYKRGGVWWYHFMFRGERIQETTKQGNKRVAEQIEAARKTQLAKGEVGIEDRKPVPKLREFAVQFTEAIETECAEKPNTVNFYKAKLKILLADNALASAKLDRIDEAAIGAYQQRRSRTKSRRKQLLSPASINRELATLRRLLRMAQEWKVIRRVPRIHLLRGERQREFVLSPAQEALYLSTCPAPLGDIAVLLLDTGIRLGEALSLEWPQVQLEPVQQAKFGYVTVLSGKAKNRKRRNVPLSERIVAILRKQGPRDSGPVFQRPNGFPWPDSHLDQQHARVRKLLKLPADFVLHSLRHTFGTRLGEAGADAFTIMRLMGHSTVTISQRYVHPSPEAVELAYERLTELNRKRSATFSATLSVGGSEVSQQVI